MIIQMIKMMTTSLKTRRGESLSSSDRQLMSSPAWVSPFTYTPRNSIHFGLHKWLNIYITLLYKRTITSYSSRLYAYHWQDAIVYSNTPMPLVLYDISIMKALIALCVSLLTGPLFSLFAFSEDSIAPFIFTTHPNIKVKRDKNGEKEVANGNNMRFSETVSAEVRPINEDPIEHAVIKYSCRSKPMSPTLQWHRCRLW